ncbi:MAG: DoxX family protein [Flavobacteriales bacterium]|jgi:uncharacterized membrane protein YphA (DoxX/SURF4 family)|nr:DoxX family protein [Flavobacteriales bacterium]
MKIFGKINLILIVLLSTASGMFKILQQEADIELFAKIGINTAGTTLLGIIQFGAGLCLLIPKIRKWAAIILIPTYILAAIAVFANELWVFGFVSLFFIIMTLFITLQKTKTNE